VAAVRPLTRVRTVLPVIDRALGPDGTTWVQVRLPGRPNGHRGWIRGVGTRRASTGWQLSLALGTRRLTVHRDGRSYAGSARWWAPPSTPTPRGHFFVEEAVALGSGAAGAPFALATSARSFVLQEFAGGPGQIALHGTDNLPGALGNCRLARLRATEHGRDHVAGATHRQRRPADRRALTTRPPGARPGGYSLGMSRDSDRNVVGGTLLRCSTDR
jgi:hypothetical protein